MIDTTAHTQLYTWGPAGNPAQALDASAGVQVSLLFDAFGGRAGGVAAALNKRRGGDP